MRRTVLVTIVALTIGTAAVTAGAQEIGQPVRGPGAKSPTVARIVGIIPGAGHIYAGETGRGLAYMGGVAAVFALSAMVLLAECYDDLLGTEDNCGNSTSEDVATAAVLGLWGWSIYDAGRAAHRTNAKRRLSLSPVIAPTRAAVSRAGGTRGAETRSIKLGLSLAVR